MQPVEQDKQHQPLEEGLIELARMPRLGAGAGKDHPPRQVGRPAPQFAIDEVAQPAEAQADGRRRDQDVAGQQNRQSPAAAEEQRRGHHAEQAAMESSSPPARWRRLPTDGRDTSPDCRTARNRAARRPPRRPPRKTAGRRRRRRRAAVRAAGQDAGSGHRPPENRAGTSAHTSGWPAGRYGSKPGRCAERSWENPLNREREDVKQSYLSAIAETAA